MAKSRTRGASVQLTPPIAFWNKPLQVNVKDLFKALARGVTGAFTLNKPEVVLAFGDAATAFGMETKADELAWQFVFRSLADALQTLVQELVDLQLIRAINDIDSFVEALPLKLDEQVLSIGPCFFSQPDHFALLDMLTPTFQGWLEQHGMNAAASAVMCKRLPSYFVVALHEEWGKNQETYAKLRDTIHTPITDAVERERAWFAYTARLNRQINERMLGEPFGLVHVYIQPRAFYEERLDKQEEDDNVRIPSRGFVRDNVQRIVVRLEDEILAWFERGEKQDAFRVLCGGPGLGKSSFVKMFATKLAAKECRVLLIPLHLVDPRDDIEKIVGGFAQDNVGLPDNPLDPKKGAKRLLLLFDGLDELSESGKTGTDLARAFLESAEKYVHRKNHEGLRLQILVSGREVAVQQGSNLFRRPGQVLTVIPYHVPESAQKEQKMVDPKGLLTEDQRDGWWQAFGAATGQTFAEMPPKLRRRDLDDVTAQPLLGFLVAKNYLTNTVDFSQRVNRNKIYESLLGGVYERAYADHVTHPTTRAFERKDFDHALEEIAIATWHGNGRTATVSEIAGRMEQEGKWKHFVNDCKGGRGDGIMQLLLAFYFRRAGRTAAHEHAFEFTHKSFSEYLVALRIVRLLKRMSVEIGRYEHDDGGWCQSEALRHWALVCGPKTLDFHIHRFFVDEVALVESAQALAWQQMLAKLIGEVLRNGMPMEKLSGGLTYMEQSRQARNAEEILLAALHACACVTQEKSRIDWPEKTSAGEWIGRLAGQTMGGTNRLAMWCLDFLDLHGCVLFGRDLHDAQLSWSDLSDADLSHAILDGAFLEGAILDRAFLFHASLKRTILEGAILEDAMLSHANFTGATLEGAILHRANLEGANFHSTILDSASLASANLDGATFSFATLMHTNFIGANLDSANFRCAQNMRQSRGLPQEIIDQFASDD